MVVSDIKDKAREFAEYEDQMLEAELITEQAVQESKEILPTTPKEVMREIKANIYTKKAPGYDLITAVRSYY